MTDWWVGVWIDGWMDGWLAYRRGYFKPIWTFDSIFININLKNRITTIDQALSNQNFLIYYNFLILFNVIQIDGFLFILLNYFCGNHLFWCTFYNKCLIPLSVWLYKLLPMTPTVNGAFAF